ncbi:Methylene-tetrahydrofolate reductase C terminal [Desulfatibacillum alkenivorans DSM 16219]|jgi:ferredoxin|uniref:Methylene-tetrahydrofolate reductase C terminal n=1 Tax=Desulfatibacillum alkenivorans DSM 16219 TaxID=1121393 RepID=A0A1M6GVG1_9BACT|nr:methylenetetrahydrofolate reductase C-terminal domain-containing protein [Desulfatibacillum alkenivorans]SHJ13864.1 Methylene-tetrahydrofolate reductase C terminal [Desulfatibacillum alkenivorans DSM 16219]
MIVAERKPFDEISDLLAGYDKVLTVGCKTCVAVCLAGGEKEAALLNKELMLARKVAGKPVETCAALVERQCDMEFLAELDDIVDQYDAIVSMACGAGVQFMAERYPTKPVLPGVNTTFIGVNRDVGWYEEKCRSCGNCLLGVTGGICPITMCAKSLMNGPCGGTNQTSCEINKDQPCAWYAIYQRLAGQDRLDNILKMTEIMDWRNNVPRTIVQPGYEQRKAAFSDK